MADPWNICNLSNQLYWFDIFTNSNGKLYLVITPITYGMVHQSFISPRAACTLSIVPILWESTRSLPINNNNATIFPWNLWGPRRQFCTGSHWPWTARPAYEDIVQEERGKCRGLKTDRRRHYYRTGPIYWCRLGRRWDLKAWPVYGLYTFCTTSRTRGTRIVVFAQYSA